MVLREVLVSINLVTMSVVLVISCLVVRHRNDREVRAACPRLLLLVLAGCLLLYSHLLVAAFPAHHVTCILTHWFRHLGFIITYGTLAVKMWRISTIMQVLKSRAFQTKDSHLYKTVAVMTSLCVIYLTTWTMMRPTMTSNTGPVVCSFTWWEIVVITVEQCGLVWGGVLCHRSRHAPDLYNESRPVGVIFWNEALSTAFYVYARFLIGQRGDDVMLFVLHFLRTQLTVTVMLVLLFVPMVSRLLGSGRQLRGTVADVYGGSRRIHRLSLSVDKSGDVRSIYCVPCGPLSYHQHQDDDDDEATSTEQRDDDREQHYTKGEVDTLIDMVSRLKSERAAQRTQLARLTALLRRLQPSLALDNPAYDVTHDTHVTHPDWTYPVRMRRSSTCTTCVTATTPESCDVTDVCCPTNVTRDCHTQPALTDVGLHTRRKSLPNFSFKHCALPSNKSRVVRTSQMPSPAPSTDKRNVRVAMDDDTLMTSYCDPATPDQCSDACAVDQTVIASLGDHDATLELRELDVCREAGGDSPSERQRLVDAPRRSKSLTTEHMAVYI